MRTFIATSVFALILDVHRSSHKFLPAATFSSDTPTIAPPLTIDNGTNLNGWNGSLEGKIFPFVGLVADLSGYYGSGKRASCVSGDHRGGPCLTQLSTRANTIFFSDHAFRFRQDAFVRSLTCCSASRTSTSMALARTHHSAPPTAADSTIA